LLNSKPKALYRAKDQHCSSANYKASWRTYSGTLQSIKSGHYLFLESDC